MKPLAKEKRAPKNKSQRQNRDIENEIEELKKTIYAAKQTPKQGREVNTKKLYQQVKQGKAKQIRHNYPTSRENIESLRNSPLTLGPGFFSNLQNKNMNIGKYYMDYSAKGCKLCGQYYKNKTIPMHMQTDIHIGKTN